MFREFSAPNQYFNQAQQNPFKNAGMQTIDFYGNIGYPKPDYPVLMQQQYYDNYQYNKMFSSQVFTPHVQPIFIAGPIYKNQPVFQGPQYLSQSLFQPIEKNKFYKYNQPDEIIENQNSLNLQSKQQLEENIKIRNEILNQWNFEEEQKQKSSHSQSEYEYVQETQNKRKSQNDNDKKRRYQQHNQEEEKPPVEKKHSQKKSAHSLKSLEGDKPKQPQSLPSIKEEAEQPKTIFTKKNEIQQTKSRKRGKRNLKIILKALTFLLMYFLEMKRQILKRKKLQANKENSLEIVNQAMQEGADWILNFAENDLNVFWSKKESLNWLENDQLSDKEKINRINKVKLFIQKLSIILSENMKESSFKPEFFSFLAQLTQNFQFPPDQYFFNFEVSRLEFNSFGAIKNIKVPQQKMVLAFFIMIRLLGFTILYAPWTLGVSNIKKSSILESNSLIIVSVLQELVLSEFREIKVLENNQNHLSNELKINARPQGPLKIIPDPKSQQEKMFLKTTLEPLIYPTYKREEMKDLFEKQIEWVDKTMTTFDDIYTQLVKMTNSWHKNNKVSITAGLKQKKKQRY
ncbi:unnamed protein product [Paramecium pentaurelia]|uniref:Transmembrane protein n=1 Tax=Paramecium pentaurelia TaxID=43138 RepID=A0A8S1XQK7_9CILI|nr:unnamed protein product [Paramecium pentaurelia]